jgi:hypothetical protein
MKAYPFYAISGNELFWMNLTYRFPLFRNIVKQVVHLYIDKNIFCRFMEILGMPGTQKFQQ